MEKEKPTLKKRNEKKIKENLNEKIEKSEKKNLQVEKNKNGENQVEKDKTTVENQPNQEGQPQPKQQSNFAYFFKMIIFYFAITQIFNYFFAKAPDPTKKNPNIITNAFYNNLKYVKKIYLI